MFGLLRRSTMFQRNLQSLRKPTEKYVKKKKGRKPMKRLTKTRDKWMLARRFDDFTEQDLHNPTTVKAQILRRISGMTKQSQRHLWEGKVIRSKHSISFSEKKTLVPMFPNLTMRLFYSTILDRKIRVQISVKILKKIRHFGNFDNYILLSKPQHMWSTFGEYLRLMMMKKLRNPDYQLTNRHIFGCEKKCNITYSEKPYFTGNTHYPSALKTKDMSRFKPNYLENYTRRQMKVLKAYFKGPEEFKKVEDEVKRIHLNEYNLQEEALAQQEELKEKHHKWVRTVLARQPKKLKTIMKYHTDESTKLLVADEYPGKKEAEDDSEDLNQNDDDQNRKENF